MNSIPAMAGIADPQKTLISVLIQLILLKLYAIQHALRARINTLSQHFIKPVSTGFSYTTLK